LFNIDAARPNTAENLDADLPQAAYGQAQVLVTPLRLARVAGAIAAGGRLSSLRTRLVPAEADTEPRAILEPALAASLQAAMREAVTSGTGRAAASAAVPVAGKTGTAEVAKGASHAWFTGFAPAGGGADERIAFAILVANGSYGGRAAAPFAPVLVSAARESMQARPRVPAGETQ
jgi:peptidoglycan glycosyltransferase